MKIGYIVPTPFIDLQEAPRRLELLKEWAYPNTEINIVCVSEGPLNLLSKYEEYLSIKPIAEKMFLLEKEEYNAAVLGCFLDPGLDAMREITTKMLVVGIGEASVLIAAMLGHKFSIITLFESMITTNRELADKAGVSEKLASVRFLDITVSDLIANKKLTTEKILEVGQKAIKNDGADCLILGCGSMGFLNIDNEISSLLKIPVVNPPKVALKITESLAGIELTHSKKAFVTPILFSEKFKI
jgi:allantoin racemase